GIAGNDGGRPASTFVKSRGQRLFKSASPVAQTPGCNRASRSASRLGPIEAAAARQALTDSSKLIIRLPPGLQRGRPKKRAERQAIGNLSLSPLPATEGKGWLRSHGGGGLCQQMPDDCVARGAAR